MQVEVFNKIQGEINRIRNVDGHIVPALIEERKETKLTSREIGQNHYKLAKIYFDKADLATAEGFFLKALDACELPQDAFAMMKISGFLVRIYSEFLRADDVNTYIEISRMLLDAIFAHPEWKGKAEYFFYLGATKTYLGEFNEAVNNFSIAFKKAQETNEPEVVAKSLLFMAQNYYQCGNFEQAFSILLQLEQLLSILSKGYLKGSMYLLHGNIWSQKGDTEKALECYKRASEELTKKSCWNLFGYINLGIGKCHKKLGDYKKALMYFELAKMHTNGNQFKKLNRKIEEEIDEVNDSNIDFMIDKTERIIKEKNLGVIDFKHRFVLLEILYLLASNPGRYFDKEDLSREIWREEYNPLIHDKLIYTSISRLRKLIEPSGEKNKYIVRGKDGYTFSPHVKVRFCHNTPLNTDSIGNIEINSPL